MGLDQRIMITRPAHQAGKLARDIEASGSTPFLFPTLEIKPTELSKQDKELVEHISQFDIIIFISPNAVEHGLNLIQSISQLCSNNQLATIGQGSAKALENKIGKQPDICPKENFNSEGLLATDAMQHITDKRILIIRGNGGREHLKETLEQRGARVDYLEVYQRLKPIVDSSELEQYLQNNEIAVIVITSSESLKNLVELTPKKLKFDLFNIPLLLINERLLTVASNAGFKSKLIVTAEASDNAIFEALKEHKLLSITHR